MVDFGALFDIIIETRLKNIAIYVEACLKNIALSQTYSEIYTVNALMAKSDSCKSQKNWYMSQF